MAYAYKEQGNEYFKAGQYAEAENMYTEAIALRTTDPKLFQNRALCRIKMSKWQKAENDSRKAIELTGPMNIESMKGHYYLAQSLVEQKHVEEGLMEAQLAYKFCLDAKDSSAEKMSSLILRAKQAKWQAKETARLREMNATLAMLEQLLEEQLERDLSDIEQRFREHSIGDMGRGEERALLEKEHIERLRFTREAFRKPNQPETIERVVPDWLVDPISFEVMHDPVITPSGVSYERVGLLRALKQSGLDPLTREPLSERLLVTNVGLKNACSEFLEKNGWAVDW